MSTMWASGGNLKVLALTPDALLLLQLLASQIEHGLELVIEPSLRAGLKRLRDEAWSLVLIDSNLDHEIVSVVEQIAATGQRVVLLARAPSVELTLDALRHGVWDILPFPINATELRDVIARSKAAGIRSSNRPVAVDNPLPSGNAALIGESAKLVAAVEMATRVADSTAPVLIQGESGTGKESLARFLHERSRQRKGPFMPVACGAMPEHVLENELFGYEKGACVRSVAPGAGRPKRASGGTLFLDEVADMSLPHQTKLVRALEEREVERPDRQKPVAVDVRVVAATTRTLKDEVAAGLFREDLYYVLAPVVLPLPPLRERGDDVRLLAEHCVAKAARVHGCQVKTIADEALVMLRNYPWPGNVRELCNVVERSLLMADGPVLLPAHLPPEIRNHSSEGQWCGTGRRLGRDRSERHDRNSGESVLPPLEALERAHIGKALAFTGGHLGRAANILGIHRNTLRRKLRDWGLGAELEPEGAEEGTARIDARPSA